MREITLGHTPDADDAFMFYGIEAGKVKSPYFKIKHVIEDIETLNKHAIKHETRRHCNFSSCIRLFEGLHYIA